MGASVQPLPPIQDALASLRASSGAASPLPPIHEALAKLRTGTPGNIDLRQASDDTNVGIGRGKAPVSQSPMGSILAPLAQGATLGFADEILGGIGAANSILPKVLGGESAPLSQFGAKYAENRDKVRNFTTAYEQANPKSSTAAELLGSLVPALVTGGGAAPEGLLAKIAVGAGTGAGFSGVSALGNARGDLFSQLQQAAKAIPGGALLGGLAPAAISAASGVGSKLLGNSADNRAVAMLSQALGRDQVTPEMLAQRGTDAAQAQAPIMAADLGGKNTSGIVRWATAQPSTAKDELISALEDRHAGQFDRIVQGSDQAVGNQFPSSAAAKEAYQTTRATNAATNYPNAYAQGPYSSPVLDQAMKSPAFAKALTIGKSLAAQDDIVQALKNGTSTAEASAEISPLNPFTGSLPKDLQNDPKMLDLLHSKGLLSSSPSVPIKALDFAKQYLDKGIERGFDANGGFDHTTATVTRNLLRQVLNDVDKKFPEYAAARSSYTIDSKPLNALDVGQKALTMTPDELTAATAKMAPEERQAVVTAYMDALKNKGANVADKNDLSAQFLANPAMRQRMQAVAPNQQSFEQLMSLRDREAAMSRTVQAAKGGSDTERNRILSGAMDTITPADVAVVPISSRRALMRIAGRAGQKYQSAQNAKTADALAPYLQAQPGTSSFTTLLERLNALPQKAQQQGQLGQLLSAVLGTGAGLHAAGNSP